MWARESQHSHERLDGSTERLFQEHPLGREQPMLVHACTKRRLEFGWGARLREEPEDVAFVDGQQSRRHVRLAREEHAHRVGRSGTDAPEELHAVHAGHAKIGRDDLERSRTRRNFRERVRAARRRGDVEPAPQVPGESLENRGLVVHAEDPQVRGARGAHYGPPGADFRPTPERGITGALGRLLTPFPNRRTRGSRLTCAGRSLETMDPEPRLTRLLFVDDEAAVLDGIRNALRRERKRWNMVFAVGPEAALAELGSTEFEVVVSDMRMPGMDGAALLERVRDLQPTALRFVLSGHADRGDVTRANSVAHHFLSKPCEPVVLRSMLERATDLNHRIQSEAVRKFIDCLPGLPPTPEPIWPMRASDMDPLTGPVAGVLAREPRTAEHFLRMANTIFSMKSSFSGAGRTMAHLGGDVAGALVVAAQAFAGFRELGVEEALVERVQNHSLLTAWLGSTMLDDPDDIRTAFTAGILHDVGALLVRLAYQTLDGEAETNQGISEDGDEEAEETRFGATHAEFGAHLLARWGLPLAVVETVAHHHRPPVFAGSFTVPWALHLAHSLVHEASGGKLDLLAAWQAEGTNASFITGLEQRVSQARRQLMGHGEAKATSFNL